MIIDNKVQEVSKTNEPPFEKESFLVSSIRKAAGARAEGRIKKSKIEIP